METIDWDDFTKVELRIGTVVEATDFPEARRPAYKIKVDLGPDLGWHKWAFLAKKSSRFCPLILVPHLHPF